MKILNIKNQYKKGFGLMEVLLSAVVIIIILAALVTIGRAALNNNEYLAERAQAIYLAQEGIELTRQIRDTNWIDGVNTTKWNTQDGVNLFSGDYKLEYIALNGRILLTTSAPETITVDGVSFARKINIITPIVAGSQLLPDPATDLKPYAMKVTSTVTWDFSGAQKEIILSEILTNWRPDF